jgi:hypothetical protein
LSEERGTQSHDSLSRWLLTLMPSVMLAAVLLRPIWDVDIFWQLKLGELILAHGGPLRQEPFAATHLGQSLPTFAWLGQAVMAAARLAAGWTGLRVFDALCWLGGFLAVAWACRRRGGSALGVLMALAVAFLAGVPTASLRPQSFAALCFGLLLALLRLELRPWRTTLLAVPLLLAWQNLHPSVSVAVFALAARGGIEWWRWLRQRGELPWESTFLVVLAAAAMLATPDSWSIFRLSAENARASVAMEVNEWLPLWYDAGRLIAVPVLSAAAVTSWVVIRNRQQVECAELAAAVVLFVMTVFAYRFVLFWAIALIPLIARAVPPAPVERRLPEWLAPLGLVITAIIVPVAVPTRFERTIPLGAVNALRESGARGTIFAHFPWGGPALDAGYPDWRVAYDGRYYRYTPQEWDRYRRICEGKIGLAEIDQQYHPVGFILSPDWTPALIEALRADKRGWRQLYADRSAVVFQRRAAPRPSSN